MTDGTKKYRKPVAILRDDLLAERERTKRMREENVLLLKQVDALLDLLEYFFQVKVPYPGKLTRKLREVMKMRDRTVLVPPPLVNEREERDMLRDVEAKASEDAEGYVKSDGKKEDTRPQ